MKANQRMFITRALFVLMMAIGAFALWHQSGHKPHNTLFLIEYAVLFLVPLGGLIYTFTPYMSRGGSLQAIQKNHLRLIFVSGVIFLAMVALTASGTLSPVFGLLSCTVFGTATLILWWTYRKAASASALSSSPD